ncbi:hypothetical protein SSZBM1_179 [Synechococcus phage S-SZBM1]|uniref:Uncharacterized protein n=1 Tax=Synechococcus phage S-SZBM1 TaxID=2926475 RepID=A0AC61TT11_9CAUD|nr:hypothetical protein PP650_gp097 [Synechococcus phage S-SZBM1]UNH61296.1 hypothetical protein SSZBM1_179 [Synechococcus phage S-SZBM1]
MPSQSSLDIVNSLFAGQKDIGDYVDAQMKSLALDRIEDLKKEVGSKIFASDEEEEVDEEDVEPQTEEQPEDTTDETDHGND